MQLLARLRVHVGEEQAQVGELLPLVAGHLADQRSLAVDDFVVRERQHEIFQERIQHAEGEHVVVILAMDGIVLKIFQRVVHPSHVPLHAEAEAADVNRFRDHGPRSGFLRRGLNVGMLFVGFLIEAAEEVDGLEVFASAEFVGNPFALLARIIEIEHGSDRVHAQAVDVILVEPEHRARHQKAADFTASVVEDVSLPVGMESLARVGVLVEMRAVEVGEAVSVGREVRRHPVENHARCHAGAGSRPDT